jgi:hypothetical protein
MANALPQSGSHFAPLTRAAVPLLLAALGATPVAAQIFKCTDSPGNVVYQNAPCPKSTTAAKVEIFDNSWTADRAEKDAAWQRHAAAHEVVAGMPVRWVREALGEPGEVRKTATAGADEVWVYNSPERSAQVGVLGNQVLWFRETPVNVALARAAGSDSAAAPAAPATVDATHDAPHDAPEITHPVQTIPKTSDAAAAPVPHTALDVLHDTPDSSRTAQAMPKVSESTHGIARGQDCRQALAELGKPDRTREVPALDSATDPMTEYFYEPAGSASPTRTRIVCANGRVEGVERTVIR